MQALSTVSNIFTHYVQLTLSMMKDETNAPSVAMNPPKNAVLRIPRRSTNIPDIGDIKKVVPINKEPRADDMVSGLLYPSSSYLFFRTT